MAKRVGANSRRNSARRNAQLKGAVKKNALRSFLTIIIISSSAVGLFFGYRSIGAGIKKIQSSEMLTVKGVIVSGNKNVQTDIILKKAELTESKKIYEIHQKKISDSLSSNPWIEKVKVTKNWSRKIVISITERKPIALVSFGKIFYMDKTGVLIPLVKNVISEMPLISGVRDSIDKSGLRRVCKEDLERINAFLHNARSFDKELLGSITQVEFSKEDRLLLSFQAYSTIVEIDQKNLVSRLRCLERLQDVIEKDSVPPVRINMCYSNIAFVTQADTVKNKSVQAVAN
jgi:hypothetical protein